MVRGAEPRSEIHTTLEDRRLVSHQNQPVQREELVSHQNQPDQQDENDIQFLKFIKQGSNQSTPLI